tara:strand:- start:669 stop:1127 length:459 start_codon:yes stop_codon:yes gene_type:complete
MFQGATSFNKNLNNWKTGSVEYMTDMFNGATSFTGDISNWDVSSVTRMLGMFQGATSFNKNLKSWKTDSVIVMTSMFFGSGFSNDSIKCWEFNDHIKENNAFALQIYEDLGLSHLAPSAQEEAFKNKNVITGCWTKQLNGEDTPCDDDCPAK